MLHLTILFILIMNCDKREIQKILKSNNHYEILGLSRNASKNQIKQAYRANALKYHPDKTSIPQAKELFHKVTTAYENLSNSQKRANFDQNVNKNDKKENVFAQPKNKNGQTKSNSYEFSSQRSNFKKEDPPKPQWQNQNKQYYSKYFKPPPKPYNPKRSYDPFADQQESKPSQQPQTKKRQNYKLKTSKASWMGVFFTFFMFFIFWKFVPDFTSRQVTREPKFLFTPTDEFTLKITTSRYKFPYYIKPQHLNSTLLLDSKVEQLFLNKLETDCQSALNLKQKYQAMSKKDSMNSKFWDTQMLGINYKPCKKILKLVKKYPNIQLNRFPHLLK